MARDGINEGGREFSGRDERLALLLARGYTVRRAAGEAGLALRTAMRRNADPRFRALVADLRRELLTRSTGRLISASTRAVRTLVRLLDNPNPLAALAAAKAILDHGYKGSELEEVSGRLLRIEEFIESQKAAGGGL